MTNHYCDMQNADVIMTIGSNNVENHPVSSKWVQKALDRGATWIVVDPRYTRSAEMADIYCPIRSGTDIAFYGGLFNYIIEHDLWQHEYVLNYTNASYLLDEQYSFDVNEGIFSGFDEDTAARPGTTRLRRRRPGTPPRAAPTRGPQRPACRSSRPRRSRCPSAT